MSYCGCPSVKLKTDVLRALFPDDDCILVGGAMTTPYLFSHFIDSLCHYFPEHNEIMRYGQLIGTGDDIEIEELPEDIEGECTKVIDPVTALLTKEIK